MSRQETQKNEIDKISEPEYLLSGRIHKFKDGEMRIVMSNVDNSLRWIFIRNNSYCKRRYYPT